MKKFAYAALGGLTAIVASASADATVFTITYYGTASVQKDSGQGVPVESWSDVNYTAVYTVDTSKGNLVDYSGSSGSQEVYSGHPGYVDGGVSAVLTLDGIGSYQIGGNNAGASYTIGKFDGDGVASGDSLSAQVYDGYTLIEGAIETTRSYVLEQSLSDANGGLFSSADILRNMDIDTSGLSLGGDFSLVDYVYDVDSSQFASYQYIQGGLSASRVVIAGVPGTAPAVPEPATWAMMIGGFGLVGVGLRRRNRVVSALA